MAIKQIPFNADMVKALLNGRKTQTRRKVKGLELCDPYKVEPPVEDNKNLGIWKFVSHGIQHDICTWVKAPYDVDDVLWVRETWCALPVTPDGHTSGHDVYYYQADWDLRPDGWCRRWYPSIHMPKEAARIFLRVKAVRAERLQDITEEDVCAEGAEPLIQCPKEHRTYEPDGSSGDMCWNTNCCTPCYYIDKSYGELFGEFVWNRTLKTADLPQYGWKANPWVWVIEFERCQKPEGWCE